MYHFANNGVKAVGFNHLHLNFSVVQQNDLVALHILRKSIVRNVYLVIVSDTFVGGHIDTGAVNQMYTTVLYQTNADLWALQVGQDADVCFILLVNGPYGIY